jgi:hypothetical protein
MEEFARGKRMAPYMLLGASSTFYHG